MNITKHAMQRLQERGLTPEDVINTVQHGKKRISREKGRTVYLKGPFVVVIQNDTLITAWKKRSCEKIFYQDALSAVNRIR